MRFPPKLLSCLLILTLFLFSKAQMPIPTEGDTTSSEPSTQDPPQKNSSESLSPISNETSFTPSNSTSSTSSTETSTPSPYEGVPDTTSNYTSNKTVSTETSSSSTENLSENPIDNPFTETPVANTSNESYYFPDNNPIEDLPTDDNNHNHRTEMPDLDDLAPSIDNIYENDNSTDIYENYPVRLNMTKGMNRSFTFLIPNGMSSRKVAIFITPYEKKQDPGSVTIYLTFQNKTPNATFHEKVCENVLLAFSKPCLADLPAYDFTKEMTTKEQKLKFTTVCDTYFCNLRLRIMHEMEIYMQPEESEIYSFDREEAEIFSFFIPDKFSRIIFSIHFKNLAENLYEHNKNGPEEVLYFTSGNPVIIRNSFQVVALFNSSDTTLCRSCNVTFYMTSRIGVVAELEVVVYAVGSSKLQLNKGYYDYIIGNSPILYEIDLEDSQLPAEFSPEKIFFTLNSITGSEKTLYVNGDNNPYVLESFQWNSTQKLYFEEEDIVISRIDIQSTGITGKKFFMAVKSNMPGLYKVEVKVSVAPFVKLSYGVTESSVIGYLGIKYYELEIWRTDLLEDKIEVKLVNEKGNVDLYGRLCKFDEGCSLISNQEIQEKTNINFFSESEGNDQLKLEPTCPQGHPYCYVLIAVRGYSLTSNLNKYHMTVSKGSGLVNLLENKNHESHIEQGKVTNFKLIIDDIHNDVQNVTIKITADLPIAVTKNNECRDLDEIKCTILYGDTRHPVVFVKDPNEGRMDGIFYIKVLGVKSANFFILPQVRRKNKVKPAIKLSEGKIYKDYLTVNNPYEYFTFHLNIETILSLDLNLQADRNELQMLVCDDDRIPSQDHYNWESSTNFLRIPHDITPEQGAYEKIFLIRVGPKNPDLLQVMNKSIEFSIVYSTDHTLKTLDKNQVFYDSVRPQLHRFYMVFVDNFDEKISFTTHVINPAHLSNSIKLHVSPAPFPNYFTYHASTLSTSEINTDKIVVSKEKLAEMCKDNKVHCPIYFTVQNTNPDNEITFSIIAEILDFAVQIKQGYEQKFVVTEPNFRAFYIPTHKNQEIDIFAYTNKENFELWVNIFDDKQHVVNGPQFESHYPNREHSNYKSPINNRHSLSIKTFSFESCWPDCVILISMKFPEESNHDKNPNKNPGFPVYMLISNELVEFSEGKPLIFTMDNFKVKYFSYDLMDIYKTYNDAASILISLTPFYGIGRIYLKVSMNEDKLPILKSYEFMVYSDHIELNRTQLLRDLVIKDEKTIKSLKLFICVYAYSDSKFLLNILSTREVTPHLFSGMPQEVLLKGGFKLTLQFYNTNNDIIKLMFNRESGLGSIMITPCNPQVEAENTFEKCLERAPEKNSSYYSIITGSGSSYIRLSESDQSDFCRFCIYIVILRAVSDLKGSILLSNPNSFISLLEGRKSYDHLEPNEQSRFIFYMQDIDDFEILVSVILGKPLFCFSYTYINDPSKCDYIQEKHLENGLISMKIPPKTYTKSMIDDDEYIPGHPQVKFSAYYVITTSTAKAEYGITFIKGNSQILQSGVISYDSLEATKSKTYIYNSYDLEISPLTLISCQGVCHLKNLTLVTKFRPITTFDNSNDKIVNLMAEPLFTTNTTMAFKLPKEKATFEFELTNIGEKTLNYSLFVNGRDVTILPYDYNYQGVIEGKHSRYYEIYVPKKGYLALEMMDCFGEIDVLVARDYEKVLKEEFEEKFKPLTDQPFIHLLKVNKGMIYFAIKNKNNYDAAFEFNLHFYEIYLEIPQTRLSGDSLHYSYNGETSTLQLFIKPISCADCSEKELKSTNVTYFAIIAENQTVLNIAGKCGITHMPGSGLNVHDLEVQNTRVISHSLIESNNTQYLILDVPLTIKNKAVYYASVKAVIDYLGEKKMVNMYYPTMEVIISRSFVESKTFAIVIGVLCLGVFLGCCLFGIHFYGKYKRIEKKLLYEVEDPKNVSQVSGVNLYEPSNVTSIEMEQKTYQGLNET